MPIGERVVDRYLIASGRPIVDSTPREPGLNADGTITLLHGTTVFNAANIRDHGFRSTSPMEIVEAIASEYGVRALDVFESPHFEFARYRTDRNRVHFTSIPETAQAYTVPEIVQDALRAIWSMQNRHEHVSRELLRGQEAWVRREGERLAQPEILAVTMPWEAVGDHAFGRKLSLSEWLDFGKLRDLHSISVPISALSKIRISPYR